MSSKGVHAINGHCFNIIINSVAFKAMDLVQELNACTVVLTAYILYVRLEELVRVLLKNSRSNSMSSKGVHAINGHCFTITINRVAF